MHDPGMVYLIGYAAMFAMAAVTLFFAKRAVEKRGEVSKLSAKHIKVCWSAASVLTAAGIIKVTVFAEFYATHSMYTPA